MASAAVPHEPAHFSYPQRSITNQYPLRQQGPRSQSHSPRKRRMKQPLTIRLDLTRTQMDRVTEAIAQRVDDSPVKLQETLPMLQSINSDTKKSAESPGKSHSRTAKDDNITIGLDTSLARPACRENSLAAVDIFAKTLAERRQQEHLPLGSVEPKQSVSYGHVRQPRSLDSSVYQYNISPEGYKSEENAPPPNCQGKHCFSNTPDSVVGHKKSQRPDHALREMYDAWRNITSPATPSQFPQRHQSLAQLPKRSESSAGLEFSSKSSDFSTSPEHLQPVAFDMHAAGGEQSPLFSPLSLYFREKNASSSKKGEKVMIGHNGWLERPDTSSTDEKKTHSKRAGFIDSIKKMAKEMTAELHPTNRKLMLSSATLGDSQPATSLSPREQSLMYCELEFHLTTALNDYIISELTRGHVIPDFLKRISDRWLQQGRPRVIGFRYDLETQIDLVCLHLNQFNFYGRRQSNPAEISGLLGAMKSNARSMRIRTFCHPDSVIAKQLIDSQSLFNLLNVSNSQQLALSEIAHFFKTIVERESTQ